MFLSVCRPLLFPNTMKCTYAVHSLGTGRIVKSWHFNGKAGQINRSSLAVLHTTALLRDFSKVCISGRILYLPQEAATITVASALCQRMRIVCDRCRKTTTDFDDRCNWLNIKTQEQGTVSRSNYYLCPECSNDFIRFLYNLTVTADTEEQKKGE